MFAGGVAVTFALSTATLVISVPLGLGGALLRTSRFPAARMAAAAYVQVIRNVPLVLILFIVYFALPDLGIKLYAFAAGVAGLSINGVCYVIEIFRGGLAGIPQGQRDAAHSLGMRPRQVFRYVVFPQLLRISFPSLGNQVVGTVLGSSVVFFIGIQDLTSISNQVGSTTFRYFEVFTITGFLYLLAAQLINRAWVQVGRRWVVAGSAPSEH